MTLVRATDPAQFSFDAWVMFYAAIAAISATLFSVMFVALQVRWSLWSRSRLRRAVATSALGELMIPLFVSIIFLMAGHPWRIAAWITGIFGITVILWHWRSFIIDNDKAVKYDRLQAVTAWFSFSIYIVLFVSGFLIPSQGVYIMAGITVWLLFSGAGEAWLLLTHQDDPKTHDKRSFNKQLARWIKAMIHDVDAKVSSARRLPASRRIPIPKRPQR